MPKLFETQAILAEYFLNAKLSTVDIEYSELNSAMSLSKKDPLKIITAYDLLKWTNWPWHESKNAKRDWKPLIRSTIVETKFIEKYCPILLKMHAGRFLRTKLQLLLADFVFPKTVQDQIDGKSVTCFKKKWNYSDNMAKLSEYNKINNNHIQEASKRQILPHLELLQTLNHGGLVTSPNHLECT